MFARACQTRLLVQSMHGFLLSGSVNLRVRAEGPSLRGGMHPRFPVDRIRGGQLKEYVIICGQKLNESARDRF